MRKKLAASAVMLAGLLMFSACAGAGEEEDDRVLTEATLAAMDDYDHFGTMTRWVYVREQTSDASAIWDRLTQSSESVESHVSSERTESDISRFNAAKAGERVAIAEETYRMLVAARTVYEETDGKYNPATGLLVDLWGFTPRHRKANYKPETDYDRALYAEELPAEKYITAFSSEAVLDFSAVEMGQDGDGYYAVKPETASVTVENAAGEAIEYTMQLNFSGIGKGYSADCAQEILRDAGQEYGYYSLGGSSMVLLADPTRQGGVWEIGVNAPRNLSGKTSYASIRARDIVLSTSGDYEQYYEIGDRRYCHIVDPATGYPIGASPVQDGSHVVCATVVGGRAAEGDARATALCCMGLDEALNYCRANADVFRVLLVWYDAAEDTYTAYSNLEDWTLTESVMQTEEIA